MRIYESEHAPSRLPTPGEDARRIVRHCMADVLAWLGEEPGPLPGERIYTAYVFDSAALMIHAEVRHSFAINHPRQTGLSGLMGALS